MKKYIYGVIGLLVGILIALPISTLADSLVGKRVETVVPVKLDGEYLSVEAIGIEGTTYAPVRALAEALGKEVGWDGEVIIETPGKKEESNSEGTDKAEGDEVIIDREALLEEAMKDESIDRITMLEEAIEYERLQIDAFRTAIEYNRSIGAPEEENQKIEETISRLERNLAEYEQKLAELQAEQPTE